VSGRGLFLQYVVSGRGFAVIGCGLCLQCVLMGRGLCSDWVWLV